MVELITTIFKAGNYGEKSGWTYILIPPDVAQKLNPGNRQSFRVKGKLDDFAINNVALLPIGKGEFMMPINAAIRKGIGKRHGAQVKVKIAIDKTPYKLNEDLIACMEEDRTAKDFFNTLSFSHQRYFSKWVDSAKTEETKTRRIVNCLNALSRKMDYGSMLRGLKKPEE